MVGFFSGQLALLAYNADVYNAMISYLIVVIINALFFAYLIFFILKNKMAQINEIIGKVKKIIADLKKPENLNYYDDQSEVSVVVNKKIEESKEKV